METKNVLAPQPERLVERLAALLPYDRLAHIVHPDQPILLDGCAMIADISGFTSLTEALAQHLSADRGAEVLTEVLSEVFTPLIDDIHAFQGSVLKFLGDALIVWFPLDATPVATILRTITAAQHMQHTMERVGQIPTPIGTVTLTMKIGLVYGTAKRFLVGLPEYGMQDVLCGEVLERMSEAEHAAHAGDVIIDGPTARYIGAAIVATTVAPDFVRVEQLRSPSSPKPWPEHELQDHPALVATLSTYVPPEVSALLADGRIQLGTLRPVVCMFVRFDGINYDHDSQAAEMLQAYVTMAQQSVARYGGFLLGASAGDKGSMLHIVFGAPLAVENQAERAVRCAIALIQATASLPWKLTQSVGISSGRVFVGPVGSTTRYSYTTIGDTINLAARLMQRAQADQIILDAAMRPQLSQSVVLHDLGPTTVKGRSEPITIATVLRIEEDLSFSPRMVQMLDRNEARAHLRGSLAALAAGRGGVTMISGAAGVGKTVLIEAARAGSTVRWASAVCAAYGQPSAGALIANLVRELLELPFAMNDTLAAARLMDQCRSIFGPAAEVTAFPYLARLLNLSSSAAMHQQIDELSGESVRWRVGSLLVELLQVLLRRGPLVIALDNLLWADPTSLAFVHSILPLAAHSPLLVLLATRSDAESPAPFALDKLELTLGKRFNFLALANFDLETTTTYVAESLPTASEAAIAQLVEKSAGHPLFLIELVHTLQAYPTPIDDTIDVAYELPNSIQELLLAQIDQLPIEARYVLQAAAVIGMSFEQRLLGSVVHDIQLQAALALLVEKQFIEVSAYQNALSYRFAHPLLQEVAYGAMLFERRRAYHSAIAKAIEIQYPTRRLEHVSTLAFHYERAEEFETAIMYHLHAADQDRLLYANVEAESRYRRVLALLDSHGSQTTDPALRAQIYLKLAQVRANARDFVGAQETYELAFQLLAQLETTNPHAVAYHNAPVLRLGVRSSGPSTLDPAFSKIDDVSEIIPDLFEGLVQLDSEMNVVPALAQRWWIEDDGHRYRFKLRPGLRWSDGAPLTAHDFVFAWRRNLHPATDSPEATQLYGVEGAESWHTGATTNPEMLGISALSDDLLEIRLSTPLGYFPYILTTSISYPQPAHAIARFGMAWSTPAYLVSNGPFRIAHWQPDVAIELECNPFYHGLNDGNLERIQLRFVEPSLDEYQRGTIDWCRMEDREPDINDQHTTIVTQSLKTFLLGFACAHEPFNDVHVRRAFAACIEQRLLVEEVTGGMQRAAFGGLVPPGMPGHSPDIGPRLDPQAARTLLETSGYASSKSLSISLGAMPGSEPLARYLQETWRELLGIECTIVSGVEVEILVEMLQQGTIHIVLIAWVVDYPDPDGVLRVLYHSQSPLNVFGWQNAGFDELVERAATSTDQQERMELYHAADHMLVAEEVAAAPLLYHRAVGFLRPPFALVGNKTFIRSNSFRLKDIVVH